MQAKLSWHATLLSAAHVEEERSAAHRLAARAFQSATGSPPTGDSAQTADEDKAGDSASAASKPQVPASFPMDVMLQD